MEYKRGDVRVQDRTPRACHRSCVEYTSNRIDGQAREDAARDLAKLMINSRLGIEDEKEMIVDSTVLMVCGGPSRDGSCNVEFHIRRDYK